MQQKNVNVVNKNVGQALPDGEKTLREKIGRPRNPAGRQTFRGSNSFNNNPSSTYRSGISLTSKQGTMALLGHCQAEPDLHGRHRFGFTLIELLVVVLIIGILAAVAVPQYKLAVVKARVSTILPIIKNMAEAEENIYLANGSYVRGPEQLDIDMPQACSVHTDSGNWTCGDFVIDWCGGGHCLRAMYCPKNTSDSWLCNNQADFIIWKYYQYQTVSSTDQGKWICAPRTVLGRKICNSLKLN